eukprot:168636_1
MRCHRFTKYVALCLMFMTLVTRQSAKPLDWTLGSAQLPAGSGTTCAVHVWYNDLLYFYGGIAGDSPSSDPFNWVENGYKWDPVNDMSTFTPFPQPPPTTLRTCSWGSPNAAIIGEIMYIYNDYAPELVQFNLTLFDWISGTIDVQDPDHQSGMGFRGCMVSDGTYLYVLGAYSMPHIRRYHPATNAWRSSTNSGMSAYMPGACTSMQCTYHNNKIYQFGGAFSQGRLRTIHIYDIPLDTWSLSTTQLIEGVIYTPDIVDHTRQKAYIIGGSTGGYDDQYKVQIYDIQNNSISWDGSSDLPVSLSQPMGGFVEDTIYLLGGVSFRTATNDIYYATAVPTVSPTRTPSDVPTASPSYTPSIVPSASPSAPPSRNPTELPTASPSRIPTDVPTSSPSRTPTVVPTASPTRTPSDVPTASPSYTPSIVPSASPSAPPSRNPTELPTASPSRIPTDVPTSSPSRTPTVVPTASPTRTPSNVPTASPSHTPSDVPTASPSDMPSLVPTASPSHTPSDVPTASPSAPPSRNPIEAPTASPSRIPTDVPSSPSRTPSDVPTASPSHTPSDVPTVSPSAPPSRNPTKVPTVLPSPTPTVAPTPSPTGIPTEKYIAGQVFKGYELLVRGYNIWSMSTAGNALLDINYDVQNIESHTFEGAACSLSSLEFGSSFTSYSEYAESSSANIEAGYKAGAGSAGGSLSAERTETKSYSTSAQSYIYSLDLECSLAEASLNALNTLHWSSNFINNFRVLPDSFDSSDLTPWTDFWDSFGTHLIKTAKLGGRVTGATTVDKCTVEEAYSDSDSYQACLNAAYAGAEGEGCTGESSSSASVQGAQNAIKNTRIVVKGGSTAQFTDVFNSFSDKTDNFQNWINGLVEHPDVIGGNLHEIHDVIISVINLSNLPGNSHNLDASLGDENGEYWEAKAIVLKEAYDYYSGTLVDADTISETSCELDCNEGTLDTVNCKCTGCSSGGQCCDFQSDDANANALLQVYWLVLYWLVLLF